MAKKRTSARNGPLLAMDIVKGFLASNPGLTFEEIKTDILGQRSDLTAALIKSALFRLKIRSSVRCTEDGHWYRTAAVPEHPEAKLGADAQAI